MDRQPTNEEFAEFRRQGEAFASGGILVDYILMRMAGESHNIAKMCALQKGPYLLTDNVWNTGRVNNNQFANCPELGNHFKAIAEKAGVSTTGKYYVHGLGRFPGDPLAWCRGRGDALERAKDRNVGLSGLVEHKAHEVEPEADIPLAEDLWEGAAQEILQVNPDMKYEDAREKAFNLRTGRDRSPEPDLGFVPHPADVLAAEGL